LRGPFADRKPNPLDLLRKESLFGFQFNDPSAKAGAGEECCEIERGWSSEGHPQTTFQHCGAE